MNGEKALPAILFLCIVLTITIIIKPLLAYSQELPQIYIVIPLTTATVDANAQTKTINPSSKATTDAEEQQNVLQQSTFTSSPQQIPLKSIKTPNGNEFTLIPDFVPKFIQLRQGQNLDLVSSTDDPYFRILDIKLKNDFDNIGKSLVPVNTNVYTLAGQPPGKYTLSIYGSMGNLQGEYETGFEILPALNSQEQLSPQVVSNKMFNEQKSIQAVTDSSKNQCDNQILNCETNCEEDSVTLSNQCSDGNDNPDCLNDTQNECKGEESDTGGETGEDDIQRVGNADLDIPENTLSEETEEPSEHEDNNGDQTGTNGDTEQHGDDEDENEESAD